jgi:hypothetical protein
MENANWEIRTKERHLRKTERQRGRGIKTDKEYDT